MDNRKVDVVILTVIPEELVAAKKSLSINDTIINKHRTKHSQTIYLHGTVFSEQAQRIYNVAVGCIGKAGNYDAASSATEIIHEYDPRAVVLMGIAAGIRGKAKLGEVVFSERIIGYESAALRRLEDGRQVVEPRPDMPCLPNAIHQDVVFYLANQRDRHQHSQQRVQSRFRQIGGCFPASLVVQKDQLDENDIPRTIEIDICAIASGEKLLRDPTILQGIRDHQHGRTKVGEMEAIGFATACQKMQCSWLVIRGVSDFGDPPKNDDFHQFASRTAAAVLADFLQHGLDLGRVSEQVSQVIVLNLLNCLLPSQFDAVLFKYGIEQAHLSTGTQNQRAIDLIRYATQKEGGELSQLLTMIYTVAPHLQER